MGTDGKHLYRLQIGNYRLLKKIGAGTSGIVYQGQHNVFTDEPIVAIKQLHAQLNSSQDQESFMQEARLLRRLKQKHILPIIDAGTSLGFPYIVMEYAAGGSLREMLDRQGAQPLQLQEAVKVLAQLADALQYAHTQGIVHRDLKPENILFSAQGEVLLADFGIAVLLASSGTFLGGIGGTPLYMAPEQFEGIISTRCDQYALGCIAYELVTGRKLFDPPTGTLATFWYHHTKVEPIPPSQFNSSLPALAEKAILKALSKQRSERFDDVESFIKALHPATFPQTTVPLQITPAQSALISESSSSFTSETLSLFTSESSPLFTDEPDTLLKQGDTLLKQHKYVAALSAYTKASRLVPQSLIAWAGKGHAHYKLKLYDKALAAYTEALHLDPYYVPAWEGKGNALCGLERYNEALTAYEEALRINPNYAPAHRNKGNAFALLNRNQEALNEYNEALNLDHQDAESWQNKATVLFNLKQYSDSLVASEKALYLNPELAVAQQNKDLALREILRRRRR